MLDDTELGRSFGETGREIAVNEFSEEIVIRETLALYRELLGERWPEVVDAS
ncbi:MAG: hypothetical protein WD491_11225 [Balneolales bacterium]